MSPSIGDLKLIAPAVSLSLLLLSCEKEPSLHTTVKGQIVSFGTNNYPGNDTIRAILQFQKQVSKELFSFRPSRWEILRNIETDTKGRFHFSFKAEKYSTDGDYRLVPKTSFELHYGPDHAYDPSVPLIEGGVSLADGEMSIDIGKTNNIIIVYIPRAWMRLHVRNIISPQPGDELAVWSLNAGKQIIVRGDFRGAFNDTVIVNKWGNANAIMRAYLSRRGEVYTVGGDRVFVPPFDTIYHLIEIDL